MIKSLKFLILTASLFLISNILPASQVDWLELTGNAGYAQRHYAVTLNYNNQLFMMTGDGESADAYGDVWSTYDGTVWNLINPAPPTGLRFQATGLVYNGLMWLIAGSNDNNSYAGSRADVWYSSDGADWTPATQNAAFGPRSRLMSCVYNNKMWVIGGDAGSTPYMDAWYSSDGINWTAATRNAAFHPVNSNSSCVIVYNNKMWLYKSGFDVYNSSDGITWTEVSSDTGVPPRTAFAMAVSQGYIWILGGQLSPSTVRTNDVWYSTDGTTWTQDTNAPWAGREYHNALDMNGYLVVTNGDTQGASGTYLNDVWASGLIPTPTNTPIGFFPTPIVTATNTPLPSPIVPTGTLPPTFTVTLTPTLTVTLTPTLTATVTPTLTEYDSPTATVTTTNIPSVTNTPLDTITATVTPTVTETSTNLPDTLTPTMSSTPMATFTATLIATPYVLELSTDLEDAQYNVKLEGPPYAPGTQYTFQYAPISTGIYSNEFFDSNFNESPTSDRIVWTLCCLEQGMTYTAQLRVDTLAYPFTQTSSPIIITATKNNWK